ncbi:MAG: hypothetical protein ACUVRK_03155 [Spirochaetota bacterium]
MKKKTFPSVCIKLVSTKEGKGLIANILREYFVQWAGKNVFKRAITILLLLSIKPFVRIRKKDRTMHDLLHDKSWWEDLGNSILEAIACHDLAVMKECSDAIAQHAPQIVGTVARNIWEYPAKVLVILGCIPSFANCIIRSANTVLQPLNEQAPDLLADVIIALIKEIDAKMLGCTANQVLEIVRKFDTGDELIKESASSPFEIAVRNIMANVFSYNGVDKQKVYQRLLSLKSKIHNGIFEAARDKPETLYSLMHFAMLNKLQKIALARKYLDEYSLHQPSDLPVEEISQLFNAVLHYITILHDTHPDVFTSVINRFSHSIDSDVVEQFLRTADDCFVAVQPIVTKLFPFVLTCFTKLLQEDDETMQEARKAFARALLKDVEVGNA